MKIKEFNKYEIKDDYAEIFVIQRNGKRHIVTVDIDDFYKIFKFDHSVHVQWHKCAHSYYPHISIYEGKDETGKLRYKNIKLTTFLLGRMKGIKIDHINNDTLNTRRSNLRLTDQANNLKNRRSKNTNNKSGHRNVCWIKGYWKVQIQIDGKNHRFPENFTDVEEAGKFAELKRQEIYGEFAGNS
jgi:hypothetical protein